jgi:hypothetical protein
VAQVLNVESELEGGAAVSVGAVRDFLEEQCGDYPLDLTALRV